MLIDVSERVKRAEELSQGRRDLFWRYFFSKELIEELDRPREIGIRLLLDRLNKGLVALVTGRPRSLYTITIRELKQFGIPVERIWRIEMRSTDDYRKGYQVKLESVLNMVYEGYTIVEVHDDEEEFLRLIRKYIPNAKLYLHKDYEVKELFSRRLW